MLVALCPEGIYALYRYPDEAEALLKGKSTRLPRLTASGGSSPFISPEEKDQLKSDVEALNAMTVAALSTFDTFSRQNLVVQV